MKNNILLILLSLLSSIILGACSTTKRLGENEVLYTGVDNFEINPNDKKNEIPSDVKSSLFDVINVPANNSLYSPYIRTPFPIGLWVYNNLEVKSNKGFKHWLYGKLAVNPVLISDVRPELRLNMLNDVMRNNGYFSSSENFELKYDKRNNKKARVNYVINTGEPSTFSEIRMLKSNAPIALIIDSLIVKDKYLKPDSRYCIDSLNQARANITNELRNKGYYFFRPEYIEYLADTTISPGKVALQVILTSKVPVAALREYRTGNITTLISRNKGGGTPDTIYTNRGMIIQMKPSHLRKNLIPSCITFKDKKTFSVRDMERTQNYLSRLGIFNAISINVEPQDTTSQNDLLDVFIKCTFDAPLEASLELNGSYKSNDYIGPGLAAGIIHKNLFGGGEQLNTSVTSSYEWQLGKSSGNNGDYNFYSIGLSSTLSFPRLLAPNFIDRTRRNLNWTKISLSANLFNYPDIVKVLQLNTSFGYEWNTNRYSRHVFTVLKLTFSKTLRYPEEIGEGNLSALILYRDLLIPQMSYTYTFNRSFGRSKNSSILWKSTVSEGGNITNGLWSLISPSTANGDRKLFGVEFAQFVKGQTQLVYTQCLKGRHFIVSRLLVGAVLPVGNSTYPPVEEMFYIGGANSIRAFASRSLGPGSYKSDPEFNMFYMHAGDFKLEFNVEYRFPIFGPLNGALFIDAGNVWVFKDDDDFTPGGVLNGKTFFKDIALGTGFGLRFDISMLVLRADLGIALHAPYDTGVKSYFNTPSFKNSFALNFAIGYPF